MGVFGHGGSLSKAWHSTEKTISDATDVIINKPLNWLNKQ